MKKILGLMVALLIAFATLVGCTGTDTKKEEVEVSTTEVTEEATTEEPEKVSMKFGNTQGDKDTQSMGLAEVKRRMEEETNGNFQIELYFSSALGGTDDLTEQAMQGAPILTVSDPGRLASFVPEFGVIQAPYLLDDPSQLNDLVETETYKAWEKEFEDQGLKLITSNWYSGARNMVVDKEINTPADLNGLKIRTIGSPLFTETINAMGAIATPMDWAEVYPSIQQKAIDGAEVQTPSSYATRLYEISKYTNKTEHFQLIGSLVMSKEVFDSWSTEYQELFVRICKEVGAENQKLVVKLSKEYEDEMVEQGMIVREVDKTPFIEAVQPVYEKLGYTELRDQLLEEISK